MRIAQLDSAENETVTYELHNVWPSDVSELSMEQSGTNALEDYSVTFTYTDWVVGDDEDNDQPGKFNGATLNDVSLNN